VTDNLQDRIQSALGAAFTVDRELGGGGMSRVFVATESELGRSIVVKVISSETGSSVSVERFKREIQVAAKLQHPHIVPLLTAGESDGLPFYTMPFVRGDSLRARIAKSGELSVNEAMHILRDIASALAYAHREGIVHRDIKPENVIISGGVAVVTDFGVAKAVDSAISDGGSAQTGLTSFGVALGTPAYMAPEQATADPHVDHRADIYSFGCVAYELLAGSSPFAGRPPQQLLAAHVTETPESLVKRRPNVPPLLASLVMKCLEKRPGDRPQTADDLIAALDGIATPSGGSAPTSARIAAVPSANRTRLVVRSAGVIVTVAAGFMLWKGRAVPALEAGASTMVVATPDLEYTPAISPDGKFIAYTAETPQGHKVFVRQVSGGRATVLSAEVPGNHLGVSWSPDGSQIAFSVSDALRAAALRARGDAPIFIVPVLGGVARRLVSEGSWPSWSPSGTEIAYTDAEGGISIQPSAGGSPRRIMSAGRDLLHSVSWSPDGKYIAFASGNRPTLQNISVNVVKVMSVGGGNAVSVSDSTHINVSPVWTPDGKSILYVSNRDGTRDVFQQGMNGGSPIGQPRRLTTGLNPYVISLSQDGTRLAHDVVRLSSNIWSTTFTANGTADLSAATQLTRENQRVEIVNVSSDGKWLAYDSDRAGNFDIWKIPAEGGEPIRLTTNAGNDFNPNWSPDDKQLVFHSTRTGVRHIYVTSSDGNGDELIASGPGQDYMPSWNPTGDKVVFRSSTDTASHIYVTERGPTGAWSPPRAINGDNTDPIGPRWSPDGNWIAYATEQGLVVAPASGGAGRVVAEKARLFGTIGGVAWPSPTTIYVCAPLENGLTRIYTVSPSGGALRTVFTEDPNRRLGRSDFATDGKRLYFTLGTRDADIGMLEIKR
jgi:Tol biopolymer transport system component